MARGNIHRVSPGVYVVHPEDWVVDWLPHSWVGDCDNFHSWRRYRARAAHLYGSKFVKSNPTSCREAASIRLTNMILNETEN